LAGVGCSQCVMNIICVHWSETEPEIEPSNVDKLENVLDKLAIHANPERPTIVFVESHRYRVSIGLGVALLGYSWNILAFQKERLLWMVGLRTA